MKPEEYNNILLNGILNKEFINLESYFFREFRKVEPENYDANEFFNGCLKVIQVYEGEIYERLNKRKSDLKVLKRKAEIENRKESFDYCLSELSNITENDFPARILRPEGGHLYYKDLQMAKEAIFRAQNRVKITLKQNELTASTQEPEPDEDNSQIDYSPSSPPVKYATIERLKEIFKSNANSLKVWDSYFLNKSDYEKFIELLKSFINTNNYNKPEQPFISKNGSKKRFREVLKAIHSEYLNRKLTNDKAFFTFCKVIDYLNKKQNLNEYFSH